MKESRPTTARASIPRFALEPGSRSAVRERVAVLVRAGQRDAAIEALKQWLAQHAQDYEFWLRLGDLRQQAGTLEPALEAWEAASRAPGRLGLTALLRIGGAHLQTANVSGAEKAFRAVDALAGGSTDARCGLAAVAAQRGDFEAVRNLARTALSLDPHCYTAWYQLTLGPTIEPNDRRAMQRVAREANDIPDAWLVHIAIGRILERESDYDAAFAAYTRGQRLRARVFSIDFSRQARYLSSVRQHLNEGFVRRDFARGRDGCRPIFVIGMPRSGTTLVEAILSMHPRVAAGGEMRFVHDWLRHNAGSAATPEAMAWLAQADDQTLCRLAHEWLGVLGKAAGGLDMVTDKFPLNFSLVGLLALCFPEAAIVHIRRDPRDICVSCYTTALYGDAIPATLPELGAFYRAHESIMEHWRNVLGRDRIVEIGYEQLIERPETVTRNLLESVGLPWHPECLAFHESTRPVATASLYQVRQPIYASSIGRWRHFESHLLPLLEALEGRSPQ